MDLETISDGWTRPRFTRVYSSPTHPGRAVENFELRSHGYHEERAVVNLDGGVSVVYAKVPPAAAPHADPARPFNDELREPLDLPGLDRAELVAWRSRALLGGRVESGWRVELLQYGPDARYASADAKLSSADVPGLVAAIAAAGEVLDRLPSDLAVPHSRHVASVSGIDVGVVAGVGERSTTLTLTSHTGLAFKVRLRPGARKQWVEILRAAVLRGSDLRSQLESISA